MSPFWLLTTWQMVFMAFWLHRYVRFIVHSISHWMYKSIPIPANPSMTSKDVTVILPTIENNPEVLRESIQSILACHPHELLLVTTSNRYSKLVSFVKSLEAPNVRTFQVDIANKRLQVCAAIPHSKTPITIMADDDVTWPRTILPWILAPFENPKMGGVGTNQRVKRIRSGPLSAICYNWLGAAYIERRNFEISATHNLDGGTSCMSGRTCAFRTGILQDALFLDGFKTETWLGYHLNADDDNFCTRWLVSNQWATWVQYNKECELETTLENNSKFLFQCSRWARSNWRSNFTSLFIERHVWTQQPWCTYALHIATFTSLSFAFDPWIIYLTIKATETYSDDVQYYALVAQLGFMAVSKVVKLMGLFMRDPRDLVFLPLSIIFGYFHGFIKLYALFTHRMTSWGSRTDGDTNDNARMSPRARRSESVTLPPGNHPGLIRYKDNKIEVNGYISEKYSEKESLANNTAQPLIHILDQDNTEVLTITSAPENRPDSIPPTFDIKKKVDVNITMDASAA